MKKALQKANPAVSPGGAEYNSADTGTEFYLYYNTSSPVLSTVVAIKERVSFPDLVAETVPLPRFPSGRPVMVCCPFHDDHHPSLAIYDDHAHCFGCGWHGDAFDWLMQRDRLTFQGALETLARRMGIPLRPLSPEEQQKIQERRRYEDALGQAACHFAQRLQGAPRALEYARSRAWTDETIRAEEIGYADGSPLPPLGHPQAQAVAGALNRWAGRVGGALVYAHHQGGRVVYLSGRSIEGKEHYNPPADLAGPRMPYPNALYFPHAQELVIVEGQACAITLGGWGFPALAMAGSEVTESLAELLARCREREMALYVVPDGDGKTNLVALAAAAGPLLRVVNLPEGAADVNAFAQSGASAGDFRALLNNAPTWLDLQIEAAAQAQGAAQERAAENVIALLSTLPPVKTAFYRRKVSMALPELRQDFNRLLRSARGAGEMHALTNDDRYTIEDGCHCVVQYSSGERYARPLCNFTAEITEDVARDDGETITRQFTVTGRLADGRPLPSGRVDAAKFGTMGWVNDLWGAAAVIRAGWGTRDQLREAIQLRSANVITRHIYTHTGWRVIDGKRVYLTATGALGQSDITVELDHELGRYRLPARPENVTEAVEASLRFLEVGPDTVTVPLWAAVYLAPLTEIVYPAFVLWLYGASGALKSTLAALALSHYGTFTDKDLFLWTDTANWLEKICFLAKDVLLVIDDFAPMSDPYKAREIEQTATRIVRNIGNRGGRGRLASDLSLRMIYRPRGLVVSTGEQVPNGLSVTARMFTVEMRRGDVDLARLTAAQAEADRYPHALAGYLLWIAGRWDHLAQALPQAQWKLRARLLAEAQGHHLRVSDTLATLYLGFDLGLAYAAEVGVITEAEAQEWRERGWAALKAGAQAQAQRIEKERPAVRFLEILGDLVAQGKCLLRSRNGTGSVGGDVAGAELLGWYDDDAVYLLPEVAYNRVARFLQDEGDHFPIKQHALRKYLAEEGYLAWEEGDARYTDLLRVGEKRYRVLRLYRDRIEGFFNLPCSQTGDKR